MIGVDFRYLLHVFLIPFYFIYTWICVEPIAHSTRTDQALFIALRLIF